MVDDMANHAADDMGRASQTVRCLSEHCYPQEPRALVYAGVEYPITRVVARWRTPAGPAFRVVCALGQATLSYDEASDAWSVTLATPAGCSCA